MDTKRDTVLLLHSSGMSSRQWRSLAGALASTHDVLAPDLLGMGESPPWPDGAPFDFRMDVDALAKLLGKRGSPAHVVGHSYGGLLAFALAQKHPALVRSVAVYDPVAFGVLYDACDAEGLLDLARIKNDPIMKDPSFGGSEIWMEHFVDDWTGRGSWKALPELSRRAFLRAASMVYNEVTSIMRDRTGLDAYRAMSMPALLMHGTDSPTVATRIVTLIASVMPRATLLAIAGAGHMGPLTHAASVSDHIREHLGLRR